MELFETETCQKSGLRPWSAKLQRSLSLSALAMTAFCYQNFNFAEAWKPNLMPLNEKLRLSHAREILGDAYDHSPARLVENNEFLGMAILNDVYKNLPSKHKPIAIDLASTILQEAQQHRIDPILVLAVIRTESTFNPKARGRHGEIGLMQLKPKTAKWIAGKFDLPWKGPETLENPSLNVRIGIAYMSYLRDRFDGQVNKYISAYNMGFSKVNQMYASAVHPREYWGKVMKNYNEIYKRLAVATAANLFAGN